MLNPVFGDRQENATLAEQARREAAGVLRNYRGNHHLARNRPVPIPQECRPRLADGHQPAELKAQNLSR
jgi:hypothetical protein